MTKKYIKAFGPIVLSALSLIITFNVLEPFAIFLNPNFSLLSSRSVGKIAFTTLVILQIILFLAILPSNFLKKFLKTNLYFLSKKKFIYIFLKFFIVFFSLHSLLLYLFYILGFAKFNQHWGSFSLILLLRIIFGFIVTFFLAWTEELIFRGTLFLYFEEKLTTFISLCITSLIFMFAHDIKNPLNLITKNWQLGLGLFLLGFLLNIIFIDTRKLYASMGAHAGLVFVKVILRRIPFLIFLPSTNLPFWVNKDLRMSNLIHLLFIILIVFMITKTKNKIFDK